MDESKLLLVVFAYLGVLSIWLLLIIIGNLIVWQTKSPKRKLKCYWGTNILVGLLVWANASNYYLSYPWRENAYSVFFRGVVEMIIGTIILFISIGLWKKFRKWAYAMLNIATLLHILSFFTHVVAVKIR